MRGSVKGTALLATAACVSVLVVRDVRASAPLDQYTPFMPGDTFIFDQKTKLYWQRQVDAGLEFDQAGAIAWCEGLGGEGGTPWRLPSYKELLTLVDDEPHDEYEGGGLVTKAIDREAFPGTPARRFWSSTVSADASPLGYSVDFKTGAAGKEDPVSAKNVVRCVADTQPSQ